MRSTLRPLLAIVPLALPAAALAQVPDYDFQWATITHPGNAPFTGPTPTGDIPPVGRVDHVYRMSKLEVSTGQWLEFANAMSSLGENYRIGEGAVGGYTEVGSFPNGHARFALANVPGAAMLPVMGITWRNAARYCNWLHNGKQMSLAALETGAYDATTFVEVRDPVTGIVRPTDARTHLPGAKFWIPSSDEWIKAAHFDPNRHGPGQPGYWQYSTTSDTAPVIGPESQGGQTNAAYTNYSDIPTFMLGAHPATMSPWGLLDTSGGSQEWLEDPAGQTPEERLYDGSYAPFRLNPDPALNRLDLIYLQGGRNAISEGGNVGLRIASAVPAPPSAAALLALVLVRRRRRTCKEPGFGRLPPRRS